MILLDVVHDEGLKDKEFLGERLRGFMAVMDLVMGPRRTMPSPSCSLQFIDFFASRPQASTAHLYT